MAVSAECLESIVRHGTFDGGSWCVMSPDTETCDSETIGRGLKMCEECKGRCYRHEGVALPQEIQGTHFDDFVRWKIFQKIEYDRLIGTYTDEQAKKVRESYTKTLLDYLARDKENQGRMKKHQDALNKLFG